jgi:outer membrane protein TolC
MPSFLHTARAVGLALFVPLSSAAPCFAQAQAVASPAAPTTTAPAAPTAAAPAPAAPGLTLETVVQRALAIQEGVPRADQQLLAADARVDQATAFFIPEIVATGSYMERLYDSPFDRDGDSTLANGTGGPSFGGGTGLRGDIAIRATLFDGRGFPMLAKAKHDLKAQRLETAQQKLTIAFDAASLFLATLGQESVLAAASSRVALAATSAADAQARFAAGIVSSNDVTRVKLELAAAERDEGTAKYELVRSRIRLAHAIGQTVDAPLTPPEALLTDALGTTAAPRPPGNERARLDIAALGERAQAADAFADEPNWRLAPTAAAEFHVYDASLRLTLTWTLFDGGERYAERDERLALAAVARLDAQAAQRRASTETKEAMVALIAARIQLESSKETAELARANQRESNELYRQGLSTAFALADASAQLFDAEVVLATARYDMALALLSLRRAYGLDPFGKEPVR